MGRKGVQPDTVVYNAAISACEKGRAWETALQLINQMRRVGIRLSPVTYGAGISACEKGRQWEHALTLLDQVGVLLAPAASPPLFATAGCTHAT